MYTEFEANAKACMHLVFHRQPLQLALVELLHSVMTANKFMTVNTSRMCCNLRGMVLVALEYSTNNIHRA